MRTLLAFYLFVRFVIAEFIPRSAFLALETCMLCFAEIVMHFFKNSVSWNIIVFFRIWDVVKLKFCTVARHESIKGEESIMQINDGGLEM